MYQPMTQEQFNIVVMMLFGIMVMQGYFYFRREVNRRAAQLAIFKAIHPHERVSRPIVALTFGSPGLHDVGRIATRESLQNKIVISPGATLCGLTGDTLKMVRDLQAQAILLCDELLVIDPAGAVGPTAREDIELAKKHGKTIRYYSIERGLQ